MALIVLTAGLLCSPVVWAEKVADDDILGLIEDNRLDEAESILAPRINANGSDAQALAMLGEIYRRKGERNKALKFLQRAVTLKPSYPPAHLYLGKLYFMTQDLDKAAEEFNVFRKLMKPLIADDNSRDRYLKGLHDISILYTDVKMYAEFYDVLKEILEISPQDQTATYNMGIYYYLHERNRSRAYEYFKKAISIDPSDSVAAKAKYAIEFIRTNPDPRIEANLSFIEQEYRD